MKEAIVGFALGLAAMAWPLAAAAEAPSPASSASTGKVSARIIATKDGRTLSYAVQEPVLPGTRVVVLRRIGRVPSEVVPSYFTAEQLAPERAGVSVAGWERVAVGNPTGTVVIEPRPAGRTYALAALAPGEQGAYRTQVSHIIHDAAQPILGKWLLQETTESSVALYWELVRGATGRFVLLQAPKGTPALTELGAPQLSRGHLGTGPWMVRQALGGNTRGFRDTRLEPGSYVYQLVVAEQVPVGPGETEWRALVFSDLIEASVLPALEVKALEWVLIPKNDEGTHLDIFWIPVEPFLEPEFEGAPEKGLFLLRTSDGTAPAPEFADGKWATPWKVVNDEPMGDDQGHLKDTIKDGAKVRYALAVVRLDDDGKIIQAAVGQPTLAVAPQADYFNEKLWATLAVVILMIGGLAYFFPVVRRNPDKIYIRRIPGVDAIEEAVGRSTEMGRPVLYVTGVENIQNIQTIASLLCLGPVAEMTAEYDTELKVANFEALTMVVAEEIVRQGYTNAGRSDAHRPENVMFISSEQFAFAAGVNGIILRDKPATNIYLGRFFAESLILAETGYVTKSIQIAGTAEVTQLPFFIAACDYTIIGEELYAVSAYLSREPKLLATLKASDMLKLIVIATVLVGAILATLGIANIGPEIAQ